MMQMTLRISSINDNITKPDQCFVDYYRTGSVESDFANPCREFND